MTYQYAIRSQKEWGRRAETPLLVVTHKRLTTDEPFGYMSVVQLRFQTDIYPHQDPDSGA